MPAVSSLPQIALLRGINVGGAPRVAMPVLLRLFGELGYTDAQTYVQSGNVVFRGPLPASSDALEAVLEERLGFPVGVALRRGDEWRRLVAANPYPEQAGENGSKVHVAFLSAEPDAEGVASLQAVARGPDDWTLLGRELYLHLPNGGGRTRLDHGTLERRLGVTVTVRNWNTVVALEAMLPER